jgi:hypothetical protein
MDSLRVLCASLDEPHKMLSLDERNYLNCFDYETGMP